MITLTLAFNLYNCVRHNQVGGPGGWNDADMLEVGNKGLTLAEQRTHFSLWCLIKSPLLIGADVRSIAPESLAILKNAELIAVNQDPLGVQAALVKASSPSASAASVASSSRKKRPEEDKEIRAAVDVPMATAGQGAPAKSAGSVAAFDGMTTCDYGEDIPAAQRWSFTSSGQIKQGNDTCLLATDPPTLGSCASGPSRWDLGRANETTAQIRAVSAGTSTTTRCLKYIGGNDGIEATGLFLDSCGVEPAICKETRCATSALVNELWYLSRQGQLIASWTIVPIPPLVVHGGAPSVAVEWPPVQWNPPFCLASAATKNPPAAPPKPSFVHGDPDITQCLQVWAGPLSGNGTAVAFVNACNGTQPMTATWAELGIDQASGVQCAVRDLYAGKDLPPATGQITATVGEHDVAVFRLTCPAN
jgi:hypothetical protein